MLSYIYILGMSHSGSTLLAFLLNTHVSIGTVGETSRITELLPERWQHKQDFCSCGETFYQCTFWNRVLAGLAANGFGLSDPDFFSNDPLQKGLATQKLKVLIEAIHDVLGTSVYLDASKHVLPFEALLDTPDIDLKVINLYRDGRGIVNSWRKNNPNATVDQLTRMWVKRERSRAAILQKVDPEKQLMVRYEMLCDSPTKILDAICNFVGIPAEFGALSKFKSESSHHIIGNPMRLDSVEEITLDEKWRYELSPVQLADFETAEGMVINRQNGYEK